MAAHVQNVVTWNTTAGNKSASITPAVGGLLVVCFAESAQTVVGSIADDQGGTYTVVKSVLRAGGANYLAMAVRDSLVTSAVAHSVTMTAGGTNTGGGLNVFEFSGMTRAGRGAVEQVAFQENGTAASTPAPVFTNAPRTENALVAMVMNAGAAGSVETPPTGFTERQDVGYITPAAGLETATADSGVTATTITWGSSSATAYGDIVIELGTDPVMRASAVNFQNPALAATALARGIRRAWHRGESGILVPDYAI